MSTLESINAQIKEHEEKIQALKNERNALSTTIFAQEYIFF